MTDGNGWHEYKRDIEHRLVALEDSARLGPIYREQCQARLWQELTEMKLKIARMEMRLITVIGVATFGAAAVVQVLARLIGH
jgi:hypothetical protein